MKLDKYNKLKLKLEVFSLEQNYFTLDRILYYFSFLGNIFLIYFGYFFVKSVTNSIPPLFPLQDTFFTVFVALFLTGYELTKRFSLEQLFISAFQAKRLTLSLTLGVLVCSGLIAGSFYLSLQGAHRLIDSSESLAVVTDSLSAQKTDSIAKYYDNEIAFYRKQPARSKEDRRYRDSIVASLQQTKDEKVKAVESKVETRTSTKLDKNKENSIAFLFITVFLELLILIGVGFDAYYTIGSYEETKKLLQTPKFRQLELNLKLLKLYYQNGKKVIGDPTLSVNKFNSLVRAQGIPCGQKEIKNFIAICQDLGIIRDYGSKRKELAMLYEQAKEVLENQELL